MRVLGCWPQGGEQSLRKQALPPGQAIGHHEECRKEIVAMSLHITAAPRSRGLTEWWIMLQALLGCLAGSLTPLCRFDVIPLVSHLSLDIRCSKPSHPWVGTALSSGLTTMAVSPSALEHFPAAGLVRFWDHLVDFTF